jgi:hypothetical protein
MATTVGCVGDAFKVSLKSDVETTGTVAARAPAAKISTAESPIARRRVLAGIFIFLIFSTLALHVTDLY